MMRGGKAFGRITCSIMRRSVAPTARSAVTYSRSLILRNSARVRRASVVQVVMPMAMITVHRSCENTATMTMANTSGGSTWKNSVTRMRALSIFPP